MLTSILRTMVHGVKHSGVLVSVTGSDPDLCRVHPPEHGKRRALDDVSIAYSVKV